MHETYAHGPDAFRLLVLCVPGWGGAQDIRDDIADAATAAGWPPPGAPPPAEVEVLGVGARPYFDELLSAMAASGRDDGHLAAIMRRIIQLYAAEASRPIGPGRNDDLHTLDRELTARVPPAMPAARDPAIAFLSASRLGPPDAARVFGLLAAHLPSWEDIWDVHEAIRHHGLRDTAHTDHVAHSGPTAHADPTTHSGPTGPTAHADPATGVRSGDGAAPLTGAALARAAERYFRRAVRDAGRGQFHPADLERAVRRMVASYIPDDPGARAVRELPGFVETELIGPIARLAAERPARPGRAARRGFGLSGSTTMS